MKLQYIRALVVVCAMMIGTQIVFAADQTMPSVTPPNDASVTGAVAYDASASSSTLHHKHHRKQTTTQTGTMTDKTATGTDNTSASSSSGAGKTTPN